MKRFFIFAAMLMTLTVNAVTLSEDPPIIKPAAEQIVLVPQGMYDIDRSIPSCEYTLYPHSNSICISCSGTGSPTELYLTDSNGSIMEYASINPDMTPVVTFEMPETPGIYYIILNSRFYYGEGSLRIE